MKSAGLILFILSISTVYSQPGANPYTARLTVIRGGYVEFTFNSIDKLNNGITYTNYTQLSICYKDPDNSAGTWKLSVQANGANFTSGANTLNLSTVDLTTSNAGALAATYFANIPLSAVNSNIVTGGPQGTETENIVNVTYRCGMGGTMLGKTQGNYTADIIFTLSP